MADVGRRLAERTLRVMFNPDEAGGADGNFRPGSDVIVSLSKSHLVNIEEAYCHRNRPVKLIDI
jgi:hypothetical protein